jgi:serine/threonine protein kinase
LPTVATEDVRPSNAVTQPDSRDSSPGIAIGDYEDCQYVASGVTAEVYRAQTRALKVIVETHAIEPHNPYREAKILESLRAADAPNITPLLETFRDRDQRFVLVFPYMPFTLSQLLASRQPLPPQLTRTTFTALFRALRYIHAQGIIHRDVKPSALLLSSATPSHPSEIQLSDFGSAWHPTLSAADEPPNAKILDVGTGPYRAPETLFGNRAYGPAVDLWAAGATLAECLLSPPTTAGAITTTTSSGTNQEEKGLTRTLFASRPAHEDGNQLGLILSIFQTLGTPTRATWPEAARFRTPPFDMYRVFTGRVAEVGWEGLLPMPSWGGKERGAGEGEGRGNTDADAWRALMAGLLRYESGERVTAAQVSTHGSIHQCLSCCCCCVEIGRGEGTECGFALEMTRTDADIVWAGVGVPLSERGGGYRVMGGMRIGPLEGYGKLSREGNGVMAAPLPRRLGNWPSHPLQDG